MLTRQSLLIWGRIVFMVLAVSFVAESAIAAGPKEKVIHDFTGPDGGGPSAGLAVDASGNLYGVTRGDGTDSACSCGTVFELSPPATSGGDWSETVLHSFQGNPSDGSNPSGTLAFDHAGKLYGVTQVGGAANNGTIFELSPPSTPGGSWTENILWSFPASTAGGVWPSGKLEMDASGNLYGITNFGGKPDPNCRSINPTFCEAGVAFELVRPTTSGTPWKERLLHEFGTVETDGANPTGGLLLRGGVLYGTTSYGGANNDGVVFRLAPKPGRWTETVLHSFNESEAGPLFSALISDALGNLYGASAAGGNAHCQCGSIYELSPPTASGGRWKETTLYRFLGQAGGMRPEASLWRDGSGDLFGTALMRGINEGKVNNNGSVFKLKPPADSGTSWTFVLVHDFAGSPDDGRQSTGELIFVDGVFYGTTSGGGTEGLGTVFSIVP